MELGFIRNLMVIALIVLRNLHHVLHLSALSFLLLYLLKAFASSPPSLLSSYSTLPMLFFLYLVHDFKYLASHSDPMLDPATLAPTACRDVIGKLCFSISSVSFAINLNDDYTPATITRLCRNFAVLFVLGMMSGALYTYVTLSRLANCDEIIEERKRWVDVMIKWSMDMVRASRWIAGGAFLLSFADFVLQFSALDGVRSAIWSLAAAGLSVGMLPLVFLCAISTQAALYLACRTHHKQLKVDPPFDFSKDQSLSGGRPCVRAYLLSSLSL